MCSFCESVNDIIHSGSTAFAYGCPQWAGKICVECATNLQYVQQLLCRAHHPHGGLYHINILDYS